MQHAPFNCAQQRLESRWISQSMHKSYLAGNQADGFPLALQDSLAFCGSEQFIAYLMDSVAFQERVAALLLW